MNCILMIYIHPPVLLDIEFLKNSVYTQFAKNAKLSYC